MNRVLARLVPVALAAAAAAVLVGLGVHASRMEEQLARRSVVAAAEAGSQRLARALESVAAEFASGLPPPEAPRTAEALLSEVRHLWPLRLLDAEGRPRRPSAGGPAPRADEYVRAALDGAARLGDDAAGIEAQRAFLRAAAIAAPEDAARQALATVADVAELGTRRAAENGTASPTQLAERLEALASGAVVAEPDHLLAVAERLAATPAAAAAAEAPRRAWATIRDAAREAAKSRAAVVRLVERPDGLSMVVAAPVTVEGEGAALLVGDVPSGTLRARIVEEAEAIVREPQVRRVALTGPSNRPIVEAATGGWNPGGAGMSTILTTSLVPRFRGWRIECVGEETARAGGIGEFTLAASVVAGISLVAAVVVLVRAADRQARLAAERQTFLDHVAHEVRTPAGALLALSEELAAGRVPPPRHAKYHEHLAAESRRLARLVEDTLDLSRLDAGRLVFELAPCDLRGIAAGGIEAAAATDRVEFHAPSTPVTVRADATALRRVVRNLVDNALRHGASEPKPAVNVVVYGTWAEVIVCDHGPGIAAEEVRRLFERFRRRPSATHETKGVGVGLAISREIARAHGGDVVLGAPGGGGAPTTFHLRVPLDGGPRA